MRQLNKWEQLKFLNHNLVETDINVNACAKIVINGNREYDLWYSFDKEYQQYISIERADAFVVTFLLYAMEHGYDILSEQKMSEKLFYQLTEYLIPCIDHCMGEKYKKLKLLVMLLMKR